MKAFLLFLPLVLAIGKWETIQMEVPRSQMIIAKSGNQIFFAGGPNLIPNDRVDVYNTENQGWTKTTLSVARYGLSTTSNGDLVYFAGGATSPFEMSSTIDIYNTSSSQWTRGNLVENRTNIAATSAGQLSLFAGGINRFGELSTTVDIHDMSTDSWNNITMTTACVFSATSTGNFALFACYANVYIYNIVDKSWKTEALKNVDYRMSTASIGNLVFFGPGIVPGNFMEIYDVSKGTWEYAEIPRFRSRVAMVAGSGNQLFIAGGDVDNSTVDIYDVDCRQWSTDKLPMGRSGIAGISAGDRIVFAGGENSAEISSEVDILTPEKNPCLSQDSKVGRAMLIALAVIATLTGVGMVFVVGYTRQPKKFDKIPLKVLGPEDPSEDEGSSQFEIGSP